MKLPDAVFVGQRYGRLLVLGRGEKRGRKQMLRCLCDCGSACEADMSNVRNGNTKSCGCLARETAAQRANGAALCKRMGEKNLKHGHSTGYKQTKTYVSWVDAKKRCYNHANKRYADYGGRGVTMCDEWRHDFRAFLRDMGECPEGMTIERKNTDGNYEPGNCVWATRKVQARNRRATVLTMEDAQSIRQRRASGEGTNALANAFGTSRANIWMVVTGKTWND